MADQKLVEHLQNIVAQKKQQIQVGLKPSYETNLTYPFHPENKGESINLATISKVELLVAILADLISKQDKHITACSVLDVNIPFTVGQYTFNQWVNDIKARKLSLDVKANKEMLEKVEKQLEGLESEETKQDKQLKAIMDTLGVVLPPEQ